jgi:seryl-tRNA synthetase
MKKIIEDFRNGIERIRWFSRVFAERLRIEMAIIRLLYESDRMTRTRDELLRKIGERVLQLRDNPEKNILRDSVVSGLLSEIEGLEKNIDDLKQKVSEIGRVAE